MLAESISVTLLVADALAGLGVPYVIGGSLASAVHGVMRATIVCLPEHPQQPARALPRTGRATCFTPQRTLCARRRCIPRT
jgi:hypothetical protein